MTFKEFCEEQEIEFVVIAKVNGETAGRISGYSADSVLEDWRKLDHAVAEKLQSDWEDLPEPIEDEAPEAPEGESNDN